MTDAAHPHPARPMTACRDIGADGVRALASMSRASARRRRALAGPGWAHDKAGQLFARLADAGDRRADRLDQVADWLDANREDGL